MNTDFPGRSVISWFSSVEQMLEEVLAVIPYEEAHLGVWSPKLTTIILEACSQLDSLWKHEALLSEYVKQKKPTISHYYGYFGEYLAPRWLVFWGEHPTQLKPFAAWQNTSFEESKYQSNPLKWWTAYNALKHDRIKSRKDSKLEHAVYALAGLFLAILRCESCRTPVLEAGWLQSVSHNPKVALDEDVNDTSRIVVCAETRLFSYPVSNWRIKSKREGLRWTGPASDRFRSWYDEASW
jgi:hypothetical protein